MVPTDYCYEVLQKNTIENVRKVHGGEDVSIGGVTNIVGMVGSGKTTLLKVLCYYLANHGYRTAIILNTVSEVVEIYKYLKKFNLSVAPLVGKSDQEKYVYSLLNGNEMFIDEDIAKYLSAPCILNGLSEESTKAWQYSERPCYNLRACDSEDKNSSGVRCKFYDFCPGAAMLRESEKSDIIVTTVAGLASSRIGKNRRLFMEEVIGNFDVVMFDECDRVQATLDDSFAPNTSFNDFMKSQSSACATDMHSYHEVYYASAAEKSRDDTYRWGDNESSISNPDHYYRGKRLIEYFPLYLCQDDDPIIIVNYLNELRGLSPQYNKITNFPLPLHYLSIIREYFNFS